MIYALRMHKVDSLTIRKNVSLGRIFSYTFIMKVSKVDVHASLICLQLRSLIEKLCGG
jgi:hypothetical protein